MDRVVTLYDDKAYNAAGFKRAAILYLLAASKAKPAGPHIAAAKKHLAEIRQRDPKNYRAAVRLAI
jgi:hypothetical protein